VQGLRYLPRDVRGTNIQSNQADTGQKTRGLQMVNGYGRLPAWWGRGAVNLPALLGEYPPSSYLLRLDLMGDTFLTAFFGPLGVLLT
jgi:hypothetical protein